MEKTAQKSGAHAQTKFTEGVKKMDAGSSGGAVPRERMHPPAEKQAIFSACFLRDLTFVNG